MFLFIVFLRALAACLITNAHYTGIYPVEALANGGLLGDVLFFAVSGFCLCNVKEMFPKWYGKRLLRCYLPVVLATAVYMLLGVYKLETMSWVSWYLYPTYYHFVASIVLLYIPFYGIMAVRQLKERIPLVMLLIAAMYAIVYIFFYDRSYYHIDNVREPMIRFLFFESMLLGSHFRIRMPELADKPYGAAIAGMTVLFVLYFASKLMFARRIVNPELQAVNQVLLFLLLMCIFRVFMGLEKRLVALPDVICKCAKFLADRTLEIYVVQYVLIDWIRPLLGFPANWIALTVSIIAAASVLHWICNYLNMWFFPKKTGEI